MEITSKRLNNLKKLLIISPYILGELQELAFPRPKIEAAHVLMYATPLDFDTPSSS